MSDLRERLRAEAEAAEVIDLARHCGDRVHEIVKMYAMTLPTVSAVISYGLLVAKQVREETIEFAVRSMEGDEEDEQQIRAAAQQLSRELLSPEAATALDTALEALETIGLRACNHSGWVENDAWGGICEIHKIASEAIHLIRGQPIPEPSRPPMKGEGCRS